MNAKEADPLDSIEMRGAILAAQDNPTLHKAITGAIARIGALIAERDAIRERLQHQTRATQECAQNWHSRVLQVLKRYNVVPSTLNPSGHPIDQVVGTSLAVLTAERDHWKERAERAVRALREIQYQNEPSDVARCRCCGRARYYGCFPNCELAQLLKEPK